jgi:hypothetical protein
MAQQRDLIIDQGTDITVELHLKEQNGSAKDLSGHDVRGKIKKNYNTTDSDQIFDWLAGIQTPSADGIATLTLTNSITDTMKPGRYVYDVELVSGDSNDPVVERILEGKINVTPSVTK